MYVLFVTQTLPCNSRILHLQTLVSPKRNEEIGGDDYVSFLKRHLSTIAHTSLFYISQNYVTVQYTYLKEYQNIQLISSVLTLQAET
jgi:hypothetical protein